MDLPIISSGEQTASALIYTVPTSPKGVQCYLRAIKVVTNGTANGKAIIYDNTSAAGKVVDETTAVGTSHWGGRTWENPGCIIENGIYVVLSGSGASFFVEYSLR